MNEQILDQQDPSYPQSETRNEYPLLGLLTVYLSSFFERFAYYGMRAMIIDHMMSFSGEGMGLEWEDALSYYITLTVLSIAFVIPAGLFSDLLTKAKGGILVGIVFSIAGYLVLILGIEQSLIPGFVLVSIGGGFMRPNQMVLIGRQFRKMDWRRDGAFMLNYVAINIAAVLASALFAHATSHSGFRIGIAICIGLMIVCGIYFLVLKNNIIELPQVPEQQSQVQSNTGWIVPGILMTGGLMFFWLVFELGNQEYFSADHLFEWGDLPKWTRNIKENMNPSFAIMVISGLGLVWTLVKPPSSTVRIGIGFIIILFAAALVSLITSYTEATWGMVGLIIMMGAIETLAETFAGPTIYSYFTRIIPDSFAATLVAILIAVSSGFTMMMLRIFDKLPDLSGTVKMVMMGSPLLIIGLLFIIFQGSFKKDNHGVD